MKDISTENHNIMELSENVMHEMLENHTMEKYETLPVHSSWHRWHVELRHCTLISIKSLGF